MYDNLILSIIRIDYMGTRTLKFRSFLLEGAMQNTTKRRVVRAWAKRKVNGGSKPYTKVNVKPYAIILRKGKILCGGDQQFPLVFDTKMLAVAFTEANGLPGCNFKEMELEELVRVCRNPKVHFDSFYLIDDKSQITD